MEKQSKIYINIYEKIKKEIEKGKYLPNTLIPSERELMKEFSVSRTTVRNAIAMLEKNSLVYKILGKGTFVSDNIIHQDLNEFYSFNDKMLSLGKKPSSKLVSYEILNADTFFSEIFQIPLNSNIYYLTRLRLVDNRVAMFEKTYLPANRFKDFDFELLNQKPMYDIFKEKYSVQFEKATETFKPIKITEKCDINNLKTYKNDVAMEIVRKTYEYGRIIEYTISHVVKDLFEYTITLNKF